MTNLTISGGGTNRVFFVDAPGAVVKHQQSDYREWTGQRWQRG